MPPPGNKAFFFGIMVLNNPQTLVHLLGRGWQPEGGYPVTSHKFPNKSWDSNFTSWWFQPNWKICSSKWVHLPQIGLNIKNVWNHYLVYLECPSRRKIAIRPFQTRRFPTALRLTDTASAYRKSSVCSTMHSSQSNGQTHAHNDII